MRLHAIEKPSRTVLMAEGAAIYPFSNHPFRGMKVVPDAKCWIFFVDGHTAYLPIFFSGWRNDLGLRSACLLRLSMDPRPRAGTVRGKTAAVRQSLS